MNTIMTMISMKDPLRNKMFQKYLGDVLILFFVYAFHGIFMANLQLKGFKALQLFYFPASMSY